MLETSLTQAAAFLPVLLFLAGLRLMDSYKLVRGQRIAIAIVAGAGAAAASYLINTAAFHWFPEQSDVYARFGAPVVEEIANGVYWMFLIATARVAFMVDAGICAFAVGAGFALVENFLYMQTLGSTNLGVFLLRGFGTATMHGGVAAIAAMVSILLQ